MTSQSHPAPFIRRAAKAAILLALLVGIQPSCAGGGKDAPTAPVTPVVVSSVTVGGTPAEGALLVGANVTLTAAATSTGGAPVSGRTTTWSSSDPSIATVAGGTVVGVAAGPVTIGAAVDGVVGRTTLSVRVPISTPPAGATAPTVSSVLGGAVTLTVPPTAVPIGTALTVAPAALPSDNRVVPATTYVFGPDGTTFSTPITLALRYDKAAIASADQSTLWLASVDGSGVATPIAGSTVDLTNGVVSASVSHFSSYTILKPASPASIIVVSGDAQSATVGATPPMAIAVRVLDASARPVPAATVRFAIATGNGTLSGTTTAITNELGVATLAGTWILGATAGTQTLSASLTSGSASAAAIAATATAGAAAKLVLSGTGIQVAAASQSLTVTAKDANGNTAASYTGTKSLIFTGAGTAPGGQKPTAGGTAFGTATSVNFTNGVATLPLVLMNAETATITVSGGTISAATPDQISVVVSPGAVSAATSKLTLAADSLIVGSTLSATVTLSDSVGNRVTVGTSTAFVATPSTGSFGTWTCTAGVCTAAYSPPTVAGAVTVPVTISGATLSGPVTTVRVLAPVATVTVSLAATRVVPRQTTAATAAVRDAAAVALGTRAIAWSSSDTLVAIVNTTGLVTAQLYDGILTRTATIVATSEGKMGSAELTVSPAPVGSVVLSTSTATLLPKQTVTLAAGARDSSGSTLMSRAVTWKSSDTTVALVTTAGVVTALPYLGGATRSASITATIEGKAAAATITVAPLPVATVEVTAGTATRYPSQTFALTLVAKDSTGATLTGRTATWTASNTSVVVVSKDGIVTTLTYTGGASRVDTIAATVETKVGRLVLTVRPTPVAKVTLTPTTLSLVAGASTTVTPTLADSAGNALTGRTVVWSISDTRFATVTSAGVITTLAAGTCSLTATVEGISSIVPVQVVTGLVLSVKGPVGTGTLLVTASGGGLPAVYGGAGGRVGAMNGIIGVVNDSGMIQLPLPVGSNYDVKVFASEVRGQSPGWGHLLGVGRARNLVVTSQAGAPVALRLPRLSITNLIAPDTISTGTAVTVSWDVVDTTGIVAEDSEASELGFTEGAPHSSDLTWSQNRQPSRVSNLGSGRYRFESTIPVQLVPKVLFLRVTSTWGIYGGPYNTQCSCNPNFLLTAPSVDNLESPRKVVVSSQNGGIRASLKGPPGTGSFLVNVRGGNISNSDYWEFVKATGADSTQILLGLASGTYNLRILAIDYRTQNTTGYSRLVTIGSARSASVAISSGVTTSLKLVATPFQFNATAPDTARVGSTTSISWTLTDTTGVLVDPLFTSSLNFGPVDVMLANDGWGSRRPATESSLGGGTFRYQGVVDATSASTAGVIYWQVMREREIITNFDHLYVGAFSPSMTNGDPLRRLIIKP